MFTLLNSVCELTQESRCSAQLMSVWTEMGDDAVVQCPAGRGISIWVMAHKHLPDCVQPSARNEL